MRAGHLQALFGRYQERCKEVTKRPDDDQVRLEVSSVAAANHASGESTSSRAALFFSRKTVVFSLSLLRRLLSINEQDSTVAVILREMENAFAFSVSGSSVLADSLLNDSRAVRSCYVLLHFWIDTAHSCDSSAVRACDYIQPASFMRTKLSYKAPTNLSRQPGSNPTISTWSSVSASFSHDVAVIDLENS